MAMNPDTYELQKLNVELSKHFVVLNCNRAAKAMNIFQIFQPSVLVLDPAMPGLNPRNFIQQIRSIPQHDKMPIIALTKIATLKTIEESFGWGVDLIYSKPCSGERIRKKIAEYLFNRISPILKPVGMKQPNLLLTDI